MLAYSFLYRLENKRCMHNHTDTSAGTAICKIKEMYKKKGREKILLFCIGLNKRISTLYVDAAVEVVLILKRPI